MSGRTKPVRYPYRLRHRQDLPRPDRKTLVNEINDVSALRLFSMKKLGQYILLVNRAKYEFKREFPKYYTSMDMWGQLDKALVILGVEKARRDNVAAYKIRQEFHRDPPQVMLQYSYPPWANDDSSSAASYSSDSSLEDASPPAPPRDPNETEEDVPGDEPADGQ